MLEIYVGRGDIDKWLDILQNAGDRTPKAIAQGLNAFGQSIIDNVAQYVAEETGLGDNAVAGLIEVEWATPDNLTVSIDATEAMAATQEADWARPWDARDQKQYEKETLLRVVTMNDDGVCGVCAEAALQSPYTMEQILEMQARWAGYEPPTPNLLPGDITNFVHPRCRCHVEPWESTTKLPVTTGQSRTPPDLFNTQEMARVVMSAVNVTLKVT